MQKDNKVSIKSREDGKVTIAGYGVVFGGKDLYDETFTPETDFMLDLVPVKPVYFNHTLPVRKEDGNKTVLISVKEQLGDVISVKADDFGLFIEAVLDESKEYVAQIVSLIEQGVMGWSSGSVPHLIEMAGKTITRWPIFEWSLTHTPAEPRTLGVEQLRALLAAAEPEPEGEQEGAEPDSPVMGSAAEQIEIGKLAAAAFIALSAMGEYQDD